MAACLMNHGIPSLIIEKSCEIGTSWKKRYDRLHLHTTRDHSGLPFLEMPKSFPIFPSKDQVVNYLKGYAKALDLEKFILFGHNVQNVKWNVQSHCFDVVVQNLDSQQEMTFHPKIVIACSGENSRPQIPEFLGKREFQGRMIHSSEFKNGKEFSNKKVAIIGCGNSGCEQAIDLIEHHGKCAFLKTSADRSIASSKKILFQQNPLSCKGVPYS